MRKTPAKPTPLPVSSLTIPTALKVLPQWVVWRYAWLEDREKWDKPPLSARTLKAASSTNAKTWATFEAALATYQTGEVDGVGFVMSKDLGLVGIDLDHCRDPDSGELDAWAVDIVQAIASYTEVSPSGTGLRMFAKGTLPAGGRKVGDREIYASGRYLTLTGCHLQDTPPTIEACQSAIDDVYQRYFPTSRAPIIRPSSNGAGPTMTNEEVLALVREARNGGKFVRLWSGDWRGYPSQSEADLALCIMLAFWTREAGQLDALFRQSDLMREKWDHQHGEYTYGAKTIAEALTRQSEHYTPPGQRTISPKADDQKTPGATNGHAPTHEPEHFTDLGNARRLVRLFRDDLRYCYDWRQWLIWDKARWCQDRNGEIVRRAKQTVQALYTEAATVEEKDERKAAVRWALASESDSRIQAMINLATSEPGIPILPEDLDSDPWLLNCVNGTINLRTGDLQNHRREDLLTKLAPVTYNPHATCPEWTKFLQQIFLDKSKLIAFIRRAIGYSLCGDVRERVLFIPYGKGRNGKSTLLELIAEMLGDYSLRTPTETLMVKPYSNIPNDLAQLPGRRFVHASESEEGKRLSESLIKDLTGRDTISARFMRGEFFQFRPVCKLWLRTNHKPVIRGTDNAIWDRIRMIPFDLRIHEGQEDHELPQRLRLELPGILAWAVSGCLSWQANGLGMPDEVKSANASYRAEMDVLADFLSECCLHKPDSPEVRTQSKTLYDAFCVYAGEGMTQTMFSRRLKERGLTTATIMGRVYWQGLGLHASA